MRPLKDVQVAALKASAGRAGFGYFMEQGLGKTQTSYADFLEQVAEQRATRMLVICPNSFKSGWVDDAFDAGLGDAFDFHTFDAGSVYNRHWVRRKFQKPPVLIVNYEAIRGDETQDIIGEFMLRPTMAICDESVKLKDHKSAQTKAAIGIGKDAVVKRILSGKPITQGPHDLWAQMRFIGNLEGRNYYAFKNAFCKMGGFKRKQVVGAQNEDILAELIDPWVFRATKTDWTDLPPKSYTIREYTMTAEMRAMYKQMEEEFILWLESGEGVTVDAAITKYIKLAQIQAGFIIDEDRNVHELVPDSRNPRLNALLDTVDTEISGKFSVVYRHRHVFDMLQRALNNKGHNVAWIKGNMSPEEVSEQKRRFNNDPSCRAILLQTSAAKYGHTLLGDQSNPETACRTQLVYENTYSLDDRSQIEDRHHRHGQFADCVSYFDFVGTSLDRNAVRALQRKESVFQAVFSNLRKTGR